MGVTNFSSTITVTFTTGSSGAYRLANSLSAGDRDIAAGKTKYFASVYNADDQRWDVIDVKEVT